VFHSVKTHTTIRYLQFILLIAIQGIALSAFCQEYRYDTLKLFYPIDKTELQSNQLSLLDSLAALLNRSKKTKFSIYGYADYLGTNPHNIDLSVTRAQKVKQYLVTKGIDSNRVIECSGKGALTAYSTNKRNKGVPEHRRVDVIVGWMVGKKKQTVPDKSNISGKPPKDNNTVEIPPNLSTLNPQKIKKGDKILLDNLNFEGGKHTLHPSSYLTLNKLVAIMKKYPNLSIEIQGHICCDSVNVDGYDLGTGQFDLSLARAHFVYQALVQSGIEASRMSYKGFGGKQRLIKNEITEADRLRNRRVEIMVVSVGE